MLLWAYGIVMPRDRPTGWERPRRVERPQGGAPAGAVVGRAAAVDLFVDGADGATTMTMAMGDDDDDDGDSATGNEVDNDGDGAMGDGRRATTTTTTTTMARQRR